jgi:ATP-dependent helicase/nuclease subunit A
MVADAMDHAGAVKETCGGLPVMRFSHEIWTSGALQPSKQAAAPVATLPHFAPLAEITSQKALAPSDLKGAKVIAGDPSLADEDDAKARGTAIHLLLEHLPLVATSERLQTAAALLAGMDEGLANDPEIPAHVCAVLDEPALAHLWTPDALTEVDITAQVGDIRFHGAIDRLIIGETVVTAIDYKSNRLVPETPDQTPEGILRQMAAYAAALAEVFPHHEIEIAILWTQTATLMPVPPKLIAEALNRVTAP